MKIAYIVGYSTNSFNGIKIQAEAWAKELERQGHEVERVSSWGSYDWKGFDAIHFFGPVEFLLSMSSAIYQVNQNIFFSPIIDTIEPTWKYKLASFWGFKKLRLSSPNYMIRQASKYIKLWFARSEYEATYINQCYSIPKERIAIVPLSFRTPLCLEYPKKEQFCLHVSIISATRKNVVRLINAAVKYKFELVLAGSIGNDAEAKKILALIEKNDNVSYLGKVSDEQLIELYKRAKVFALPSINEGVGMVAVEAASFGCDIVITKIGGPKEYYGKDAYVVDPFNIDEIGQAVVKALDNKEKQPKLMKDIQANYNLEHCVRLLANSYMQ